MVGLQIKYCGAKLKDVNLHERMNSTSQSIDCQWMMLNGAYGFNRAAISQNRI